MTTARFTRTAFCLTSLLALAIAGLTGCNLSSTAASSPIASPAAAGSGFSLGGTVHGGQQPIAFANLQAFVAGTPAQPTAGNPIVGGFGQGASPLFAVGSMTLNSSNNYFPNGMGTGNTCKVDATNSKNCTALPQTDAYGSFSVSGDYSTGTSACSGTNPVYLVATGGNPGLGATPISITGYSIAGSVITFTLSGATLPTVGSVLTVSNLSSGTLNGTYTVTSATAATTGATPTPGMFTAAISTGSGSSTTETATATYNYNNPYIALMVSLGQCQNLSASTFLNLNEVTTVGAVWALQQFMAPPTGLAASTYTVHGGSNTGTPVNIGASSGPAGGYGPQGVQTQQIGLQNAFRMVDNLVDYTKGTATARNAWATSYTAKVNTVADIIAACINSDPTISTLCTGLMTDSSANSVAVNKPADTIQAAYTIAQNPANNVSTLFTNYVTNILPVATPFSALASAPNDFTLAVGLAPNTVAGSTSAITAAISGAQLGAVDEYGHIWLSNNNNAGVSTPTGANTTSGGSGFYAFVTELDANGNYLAGPFTNYQAAGGYQAVAGTGITYVGDPCQPNLQHNLYFASTGPKGMTIDQNNVIYVTNSEEIETTTTCNLASNRSVMRINGSSATSNAGTVSGVSVLSGLYMGGGPYGITADANDNIWVGISTGGIAALTNSSSTSYTYNFAGGNTAPTKVGSNPSGVAVDMLGNVWFDAGKTCSAGTIGILYNLQAASYAAPNLLGGYYPAAQTCTGTSFNGTIPLPTGVASNLPVGIAADANNGLWITSNSGTTAAQALYVLPTNSGWSTTAGTAVAATAAANTTAALGGLNNPYSVVVDGSNRAWFVNQTSPYVIPVLKATPSAGAISQAALTSAMGTTGLSVGSSTGITLNSPKFNMIDPSGNVWIANSSSTGVHYITVLVGAATPVITPLTFQALYNRVGQTPQ